MSSKYKCPECDATNGIAKSQGRTSSVFHFHVRTNERLQDNIIRSGDGTSCESDSHLSRIRDPDAFARSAGLEFLLQQ